MVATPEETPRILIVDDERVIREILSDFLTMEGFLVRTMEDGKAAIEELRRRPYNLVISDLKMPKMGGIELLERIADENLNVLTVIMTGFGTVETAIEAMKKGAYDYILKPFKVEEVVHIVRRGLNHQQLQLENIRLREALSIYQLTEALNEKLRVEPILELISDAAMKELKADVVTLTLNESPDEEQFVERVRRFSDGTREEEAGDLKVEELLSRHRKNQPLLAHGPNANLFFSKPPAKRRIVSFCAVPLAVPNRIVGMLSAHSFSRNSKFTEGQRKMLSVIASRAAVSIENARLYENLVNTNEDLETAAQQLEENFRQTIVAFANALEESDRYTHGHSERVSIYSKLIAEGMGLDPHEVDIVVLSARVHDIGKIGIPTDTLNKPGRLTEEEFALFRTHPEKGQRILEPIPFLRDLVPGVLCHHEAWDGSGYPQGLKGEEIPQLGRIIAVADAFDAMTSDRPYRKALGHETAVAELERCAGTQFDAKIVPIFISRWRESRSQMEEQLRVVTPAVPPPPS